ncbi:MAG TPA: hypothetical protein VM598_11885 [Bdellovibrionota bacterium]|nr:hypothetical protein [Bdellovibrionota bacterium]
MRLVDFLIRLLEAHSQTLQRLAALFGEEILLEMLEKAAERTPEPTAPRIQFGWFSKGGGQTFGSPYAELEGAVRELTLSPVLQFHLWAYPVYRAFIESELELSARMENPQPAIDVVLDGAKVWLDTLPIASEFRLQAEKAAEVPWIRFRSSVLKGLGQRPIGVV